VDCCGGGIWAPCDVDHLKGCRVDPTPPARRVRPATSLATGPVADEARTALPASYASWGLPSYAAPVRPRIASHPAAQPIYALTPELVETVISPYGHMWWANTPAGLDRPSRARTRPDRPGRRTTDRPG
jgi:hypothetical protein